MCPYSLARSGLEPGGVCPLPARRRIDLSVPSAARINDWLLDGQYNYEVDRMAGEQLLRLAPSSKEVARNNRWFLERVVRVMIEQFGIRQFIDFGSGLPTQRNVHQVAQELDPRSRVVYVDKDPVVLVHGHSTLDEDDRTALIPADIADTEYIFERREFKKLIDVQYPVGVLFNSVLHCVSDKNRPEQIVRRVVDRLQPGSAVAICHLVSDDDQLRHDLTELMKKHTRNNWGRVRTRREVEEYFTDFLIQPPGLVDVTDWRPKSDLQRRQRSIEWFEYGGLAILPGGARAEHA
ncbi:SAM-dependent methyltransferase [Streptomyces sp. NPDC047046]|uniref:SAM-dependent methyltransferase n=1 Tax=Streptomyces sp. NPDC047046 TaxID=3155378 RepID=UPI0033D25293